MQDFGVHLVVLQYRYFRSAYYHISISFHFSIFQRSVIFHVFVPQPHQFMIDSTEWCQVLLLKSSGIPHVIFEMSQRGCYNLEFVLGWIYAAVQWSKKYMWTRQSHLTMDPETHQLIGEIYLGISHNLAMYWIWKGLFLTRYTFLSWRSGIFNLNWHIGLLYFRLFSGRKSPHNAVHFVWDCCFTCNCNQSLITQLWSGNTGRHYSGQLFSLRQQEESQYIYKWIYCESNKQEPYG